MPYHAKTIVVGCGNILFKDDGYGPIVVNLLEKYFENETEDDFDPVVISPGLQPTITTSQLSANS